MAQEIDNNFIDQCTNRMNELLSFAKDKGDSNIQLILEAFKQLVLVILASLQTIINSNNELKKENERIRQENEIFQNTFLEIAKDNANKVIEKAQNAKEKFEGHGSEKQPRKKGVDSSSHQRDNQKPREPRPPKTNVQKSTKKVYYLFDKELTEAEAKKLLNTIVTDPTTGKRLKLIKFTQSATKKEFVVNVIDVTYYKAEYQSLDDDEKILAPIAEADFLPKAKIGMSLMSELINMRFMLKSPIYRLVQYLEDLGLKFSKQQLYSYFEICSFMLMPLFERLEEELANANVIGIDETFWSCREKRRKQLEERNKNGMATNQDGDDGGSPPSMRCYIFGMITQNVCLYYFRTTRDTAFAKQKLIEYDVKSNCFVITDAFYKGKFNLDDETLAVLFIHAFCFVHVRRYFCTFYNSAQRDGVVTATIIKHHWEQDVAESKLIMDLISNLFHKFNELQEAYEKDNQIDFEKLKIETLKPLVDEIFEKGEAIWKDIRKLKKNEDPANFTERRDCCDKFYKAIQYLINAKDGLQKFLYSPHGILSNNFTEQKFRELDILRESMIANDTFDGAKAIAIYYTIYKTALLHKINFYDYLMKVFKVLTLHKDQINYEKDKRGTIIGYKDHSIPENIIESLLPWNIEL